MGYAGGVVAPDTLSRVVEEVYEFLRAALRQVAVERPYRGPKRWREGAFLYTNESQGNADCFWGTETITHQGYAVFRLRYNGGLLR